MFVALAMAHCPSAQETEAARIVESELLPLARAHGVSFPESCPFHPSRDGGRLVRLSRAVGPGRHRCAGCGEEFVSADLLESHLATKHAPDEGSCWSERCAMLGCAGEDRKKRSDAERAFETVRCRETVTACVEKGQPLHGAMLLRLCEKLRREGAAETSREEDHYVLRIVGLTATVVMLGVFYALILLWRQESHSASDLQASTGWMARARRWTKKKEKGY